MKGITTSTSKRDRRCRGSFLNLLRILFLGFLLIAPIAYGSGLLAARRAGEEPPIDEGEPGVWEEIQRLYEKAKEKGERVPKDIYEWAREDVQGIGDWEYKILTVDHPAPEQLQKQLNELGVERWDCFWVERRGDDVVLYLKRPSRTYLRHIPFSDLMRIIPSGESGGGATE